MGISCFVANHQTVRKANLVAARRSLLSPSMADTDQQLAYTRSVGNEPNGARPVVSKFTFMSRSTCTGRNDTLIKCETFWIQIKPKGCTWPSMPVAVCAYTIREVWEHFFII